MTPPRPPDDGTGNHTCIGLTWLREHLAAGAAGLPRITTRVQWRLFMTAVLPDPRRLLAPGSLTLDG